jgi:hypothetical protein
LPGRTTPRTGAVYGFKGPDVAPLTHSVGEWNDYEITVNGPDLTVALNGQVINQFHFTGDPQSPRRGLPGLQTHTGRLFFHRIQWRAF